MKHTPCAQLVKSIRLNTGECISLYQFRGYWEGYRYDNAGKEIAYARCQDYFTLTRVLCTPIELIEVDKVW